MILILFISILALGNSTPHITLERTDPALKYFRDGDTVRVCKDGLGKRRSMGTIRNEQWFNVINDVGNHYFRKGDVYKISKLSGHFACTKSWVIWHLGHEYAFGKNRMQEYFERVKGSKSSNDDHESEDSSASRLFAVGYKSLFVALALFAAVVIV